MVRFAIAACAVLTAAARIHAQVELNAVGSDRISIVIDGQPFSNFYIGVEYPKPFLAPLRTANGVIVTRRWPMDTVDGESRDHPHHKGLWIGHGDIDNVNFWESEAASKPSGDNPTTKGLVILRSVDEVSPGKKSGRITATFEWQIPGQRDVIEERRTTVFREDPDVRTIDIDVTFTAKAEVKFADTKEGFFAIRVADSMAEDNGGLMTNSDGAQTEKNVWGKRANWVDYDGTAEGQRMGIVIFDHPQNYNHPTPWHARAYGLLAANPFGLKAFDPKAKTEGGHSLRPGESMRFLYRVVIHPGDVPKRKIADWYLDYSKKVK